MRTAAAGPEAGLGGKLFYVGELDEEGRALAVGANVAGAATLAATANRVTQKQALRDGVADFLVNSLDEALRVLKNELRKCETVAVCVALAPNAVEREMQERGVAPDLLRTDAAIEAEENQVKRGRNAQDGAVKDSAVLTWHMDSALPEELARLDGIALECLGTEAWEARRWLQLAPRFLGRMAQGSRLLECDREFAGRFTEQVRKHVELGEFRGAVEIRAKFADGDEERRLALGESTNAS